MGEGQSRSNRRGVEVEGMRETVGEERREEKKTGRAFESRREEGRKEKQGAKKEEMRGGRRRMNQGEKEKEDDSIDKAGRKRMWRRKVEWEAVGRI